MAVGTALLAGLLGKCGYIANQTQNATVLLSLIHIFFSYAKHNGIFGMNIYHVPIVPIFIMIFLVGLLQIVLSCVLSSNRCV